MFGLHNPYRIYFMKYIIKMLEYPVIVETDGIKIDPEKMIVDKMYYCIYDNKVYIFYKDEEKLTHCYEIDDQTVVQEIVKNPNNLEDVLLKHSKE
jgi:hypothetical protein